MNDEQSSAAQALEAMGLSVEEMEETLQALRDAGPQRDAHDPRICLCGHSVKRHTTANGIVYCKPTKMPCPCKNIRPVLEASDLRKFIRKTSGAGALHALSLGIASSYEAGKNVKWIVDLVCDRCGEHKPPIVPVPVTQRGTASPTPTGYDAFLCATCRMEV